MEYQNEKLIEFERYLNNRKIAIIGLGVSNIPLIDYMYEKNAKVTVFDDRTIDKISKDIITPIKDDILQMIVNFEDVFGLNENYTGINDIPKMILNFKEIINETKGDINKAFELWPEISEILKLSQKQIFNYLTMIKNIGYDFNRHYFHDGNIKYSFIHQYSKPQNKEIIFSKGVTKLHAIVISDTHIGSNFERLDLLNEVYEDCSKNSINIIFHCGDIIDNYEYECKINKESRVEYLLKNYPYDKNILTFAILGNHDLGPLTEFGQNLMLLLNNYRHDIIALGYLVENLNLQQDAITLYHPFHKNSFISKRCSDSKLILQGHSHIYKIEGNIKEENPIRVLVPSLSDISVYKESFPSILDLEIELKDENISVITIRQLIYLNKKFTPINVATYDLDNIDQTNELYNQDIEKNLVLKKQTADLSQIDKFNARWSK